MLEKQEKMEHKPIFKRYRVLDVGNVGLLIRQPSKLIIGKLWRGSYADHWKSRSDYVLRYVVSHLWLWRCTYAD